MDEEIKQNRLEVNERFPEFGIKLILKYNMYLLGSRLVIKDGLFNDISIECDEFIIDKDSTTTDLIAGSTKIVLWNKTYLSGYNIYI